MFAQHIRWLPAVVLQYVAPAAVRPLLLALGSMAEQGPYLNWIDLEAQPGAWGSSGAASGAWRQNISQK